MSSYLIATPAGVQLTEMTQRTPRSAPLLHPREGTTVRRVHRGDHRFGPAGAGDIVQRPRPARGGDAAAGGLHRRGAAQRGRGEGGRPGPMAQHPPIRHAHRLARSAPRHARRGGNASALRAVPPASRLRHRTQEPRPHAHQLRPHPSRGMSLPARPPSRPLQRPAVAPAEARPAALAALPQLQWLPVSAIMHAPPSSEEVASALEELRAARAAREAEQGGGGSRGGGGY